MPNTEKKGSGIVMPSGRAEKLAEDHWKYIKSVLAAHFGVTMPVDYLAQIELHYKTAMIHGYKHGWTERDEMG